MNNLYNTQIINGDGDNGDIWAGNSTTIASINVGSSITGSLETIDDIDWIAVNLVAGETYTISLSGTGLNPVSDTYLRLYSPGSLNTISGNLVAFNDDGGSGLNSKLTFTASITGTYYIDARSYNGNYSGDYSVGVVANLPEVPFTDEQIADQLRAGYWESIGYSARSFNVGVDNSISVDITSLSASYQDFARQALQAWTDITGIQFIEINGVAEIEFQSTGSGSAWSSSSTTGMTINSSIVNVSVDWINQTSPQYTLQTFIHEIGHAIGLGHAGNYNGSASYGTDNHYPNDSWQASIMSYFDQEENTYVNASFNYLLTPMLADILAIQTMYGISTTTRTGNTIYGYNSNAGDVFEFDNWQTNYAQPTFALTINDSAGIDTIDLSGSSDDNVLNLVAGTISDIMGKTGNLAIANATIIENAIGGSGNDIVRGNSADNNIRGGAGNDTLYGGDGNDYLRGGVGADILYGNAGIDIFVGDDGNDTLYGGSGNDRLYGRNGNDIIRGGSDDDILKGENGIDKLYGDAGNDKLYGGSGDDRLYGGSGVDYLYGQSGDDGLYGSSGNDILYGGSGIDRLRGGDDNDILYGDDDNDVLLGDNGNDTLYGGAGNDTLYGGDGNDYLRGGVGADILYGNAGIDIFVGDDGNDTLYGGSGNDRLYGRNGNDIIRGGSDNDILKGENGIDKLYGDAGNDKLYGGSGYDRLYGGNGVDYLYGEIGNDKLYGGNGDDRLYGGSGGDRLRGGDGDDILYGDDGNDVLLGDAGNDTLSGGAANDRFVFDSSWGDDEITDFNVAGNEKIDFSSIATITNMSDISIFYGASDTIITYGADSITLIGTTATLQADDFIFV